MKPACYQFGPAIIGVIMAVGFLACLAVCLLMCIPVVFIFVCALIGYWVVTWLDERWLEERDRKKYGPLPK